MPPIITVFTGSKLPNGTFAIIPNGPFKGDQPLKGMSGCIWMRPYLGVLDWDSHVFERQYGNFWIYTQWNGIVCGVRDQGEHV